MAAVAIIFDIAVLLALSCDVVLPKPPVLISPFHLCQVFILNL
jgi:hypothetical protein